MNTSPTIKVESNDQRECVNPEGISNGNKNEPLKTLTNAIAVSSCPSTSSVFCSTVTSSNNGKNTVLISTGAENSSASAPTKPTEKIIEIVKNIKTPEEVNRRRTLSEETFAALAELATENEIDFEIEEISLNSSYEGSEDEAADPPETPEPVTPSKKPPPIVWNDEEKDVEVKKRKVAKPKTSRSRIISLTKERDKPEVAIPPPPPEDDIDVDKISKLICLSIRQLKILNIKVLLEQEDVCEIIKRITSPTWRKRSGHYSSVAISVINCFITSLGNCEEEIRKKIEILRLLAEVNKQLFGQVKPEPPSKDIVVVREQEIGVFAALTSPLSAPGVHPDLLCLFISLGSNPANCNKSDGRNVLHQIAENCKARNHSMTEEVLQKYANFINLVEKTDLREMLLARDSKGNTPLWTVLQIRDPPREVLQVFRNAGADFNESNPEHTPLSWAMGRKIGTIRKIIEFGGSLEWKGRNERSLLHEAAKSANLDAVKFLVEEKGFNVNVEDLEGLTPLDYLLIEEKPDGNQVISKQDYFYTGWKLKELGGSFKTKPGRDGKTLVHEFSIRSKYFPWAVEFLLSLGEYKVDEVDNFGNTALLLICQDFKPDRRLLKDGNWNAEGAQWPKHRNPERKAEVVKILLNHGADIYLKNKKGKSPYHVCQ